MNEPRVSPPLNLPDKSLTALFSLVMGSLITVTANIFDYITNASLQITKDTMYELQGKSNATLTEALK